MPLIEVDGHRVHALEMGQGTPVVMLHGMLLGSLAQWYFTAAHPLAKRYRVVLYDLRGHGRSERLATGYDFGTLVADLQGVCDAFSVQEPVDLVGHSYGGLISLHYALRFPDRVRRLVLVDVPLPPGDRELYDAAFNHPAEVLLGMLPDRVRGDIVGGGRRAQRLLESLQFLTTETTLLADVGAETAIDDAALAGLTTPTLCLYGEDSACLPASERLARVLPTVRTVTVPGGHFVPVESPVPMTTAIAEFLDA